MTDQQRLIRKLEKMDDAVIIVLGVYEDTISVLNSYNGVRVFTRDKLDWRITMASEDQKIPYFETVSQAMYAMLQPRAPKCAQVSFKSALKMMPNELWADFTTAKSERKVNVQKTMLQN